MRPPSVRNADGLLSRFNLPMLLPNLIGGVTLGAIEIFYSLSFASLIFRGALEGELMRGSTLILVSAGVFFIGIGLLTSMRGVMGSNQDITSVLLAVMVAGAVASLPMQAAMPTALAVILSGTVFTGLVLLLTGWLRLGRLIRYIPYPVSGGFLAATGWLLFSGAFSTITPYELTLANLPHLLRPDQLILWLPALILALALTIGLRFVRSVMAMPAILLAAAALFYGVLWVLGIGTQEAITMGLFFPPSGDMAWLPLLPGELGLVEWSAVLSQAGNMAVLAGMTLVAMTMNLSAVELAYGREFDLNHEFRTTGMVNVAAGMTGGIVGYHGLSLAAVARRMQMTGRLGSIIAGVVCLVVVIFELPLTMYLPKFLAGGLLLFLGLDFLYDWLFTGLSRFAKAEFAIVLMILVVIVATDFLTGVVVGLLAMVVLFVVSYSRTSAVLRSYSAEEVRSSVNRSPASSAQLSERGAQVHVMELQGFLFFGTANTLLEQVKQRLTDRQRPPLTFLLLDFRQVTGVDSSTALIFQKIQALADEHAFQVVLTGLTGAMRARLQINSSVRVLEDLDQGLEWCEDQLVDDGGAEALLPDEALIQVGFSGAQAASLLRYMDEVHVPSGEVLIQRGDTSDAVYLLVEGKVSIYQTNAGGHKLRARKFGPGSVMGEVGVYLGLPRTATVTVDQPVRLLRLTTDALERMQTAEPELAAAFHAVVVRMLAQRVLLDDRGLAALRR